MPGRVKNGRDCILLSGILLIACGFMAMISSFSAVSIVDTAMEEACVLIMEDETCLSEAGATACNDNCTASLGAAQVGTPSYDACFADCKVARAADFGISMQDCQAELRSQSGCGCESDGDGGWQCDCDGQLVGVIQEYWEAACYILGTLALFNGVICTGLPAVYISLRGSRGYCCRITCFSTCAALWFLPFLGIGAVFIMLAFLHQWQGSITDALNDCEAEVSDTANGGALTFNFESGSNCGLTAFCEALQSVSKDVMAPALAVGIPFIFGGIVMMIGSYACCCCAASLPNPNAVSDSKMENGELKRSGSRAGSKRDVADDGGPKSSRSRKGEGDGAASIDVTKVDKASFIASKMGEVGPEISGGGAKSSRGSRKDLNSARGEGYDSQRAKDTAEEEKEEQQGGIDAWEKELKSHRENEEAQKTARSQVLSEKDARLQRKESRRLARAASRGGSSRGDAPRGSKHDWRSALENLAQEREAERQEEAATVIQQSLRSNKQSFKQQQPSDTGQDHDRDGGGGGVAEPEPTPKNEDPKLSRGGSDAGIEGGGGRGGGGFGPLGLNAREHEVSSNENSPR